MLRAYIHVLELIKLMIIMVNKTEKITLFTTIGSIIAGLIASLCCIGPLLFVVLGLSGAAIFTVFEQYRLIFGLVAFGFLALGFFFTYRNNEQCASGSSCTVNKSTKFNKILPWVATILVIGFVFSPNIIGLFVN